MRQEGKEVENRRFEGFDVKFKSAKIRIEGMQK